MLPSIEGLPLENGRVHNCELFEVGRVKQTKIIEGDMDKKLESEARILICALDFNVGSVILGEAHSGEGVLSARENGQLMASDLKMP